MTEMLEQAMKLAEQSVSDAAEPEAPVTATEGEGTPDPADRGSAPDPEEAEPADEGTAVVAEADAQEDDEDAVETFVLPDGTEITADQIVERFSKTEDEAAPTPTKVEDVVAQVLERLNASKAGTQVYQSKPSVVNPLENPQSWMETRWGEYIQSGRIPRNEQERDALIQTIRDELREEQSLTLHRSLLERDKQEKERKQAQERESLLASLTSHEAAPNLQTEQGKQLLAWRMAKAQADGETDLAKVVKEANEFLGAWLMKSYVEPKKEKMAKLRRKILPSGGTPRAAAPKNQQPRYEGFAGMLKAVRASMTPEE